MFRSKINSIHLITHNLGITFMRLSLIDRQTYRSTEEDFDTAVDRVNTVIEREEFLLQTPNGALIHLRDETLTSSYQYYEPDFSSDSPTSTESHAYVLHESDKPKTQTRHQHFCGLFQLSPMPLISKAEFMEFHCPATEDRTLAAAIAYEDLVDKVLSFQQRSMSPLTETTLDTVREDYLEHSGWANVSVAHKDSDALFKAIASLPVDATSTQFIDVPLSMALETAILEAESTTQSSLNQTANLRIQNMANDADAQVALLIQATSSRPFSQLTKSIHPS